MCFTYLKQEGCGSLYKPYLALIIAGMSISWAAILARLTNAPSYVIALWRLVFSSIVLFVLALLKRSYLLELRQMNRSEILLMSFSGIMLAVHLALWVESLFLLPVSLSVIIVDTYPVFSIIIDYKLFKTRISIIQIIGILLAFTGITILSLMSEHVAIGNAYGILLAFIASLAAAAYFSIGKFFRKKYSTTTYSLIVYSSASLTLLLCNLMLNYNIIYYDIRTWILFALFAIVPMLGGHTMINYALKYFPLSSTIAIVLVEPVGATILAALILSEYVNPIVYLIMAQILLGLYMAIRGTKY